MAEGACLIGLAALAALRRASNDVAAQSSTVQTRTVGPGEPIYFIGASLEGGKFHMQGRWSGFTVQLLFRGEFSSWINNRLARVMWPLGQLVLVCRVSHHGGRSTLRRPLHSLPFNQRSFVGHTLIHHIRRDLSSSPETIWVSVRSSQGPPSRHSP